MNDLMFTVWGDPVPKGRPRVTTVGGHARAYTPTKTTSWERDMGAIARQAFLDAGWAVPYPGKLMVWVDAVVSRPKVLQRKKDPDGLIWRSKRPDTDNVIKAVLDGFMKGGAINDDAQVVAFQARSLYAERNGAPRVEVLVSIVEGDEP